MVEFALCATFIFTAVFGVIDFGRAMFTYDLIANASRLGTRYAIVRGSTCNTAGCTATQSAITSYVQGQSPGLDSTKMTVSSTWSSAGGCNTAPYQGQGCLVTVTVTYPFSFVAFPSLAQISMTSTSQMTISQ